MPSGLGEKIYSMGAVVNYLQQNTESTRRLVEKIYETEKLQSDSFGRDDLVRMLNRSYTTYLSIRSLGKAYPDWSFFNPSKIYMAMKGIVSLEGDPCAKNLFQPTGKTLSTGEVIGSTYCFQLFILMGHEVWTVLDSRYLFFNASYKAFNSRDNDHLLWNGFLKAVRSFEGSISETELNCGIAMANLTLSKICDLEVEVRI